eukprot:363805-Chlamydomonas_euryale.AAC.6
MAWPSMGYDPKRDLALGSPANPPLKRCPPPPHTPSMEYNPYGTIERQGRTPLPWEVRRTVTHCPAKVWTVTVC